MAWLLQYHWAHQSLILGMENSSYIQHTRLILYAHFPPTAFANVTKFTRSHIKSDDGNNLYGNYNYPDYYEKYNYIVSELCFN